MQPIWVVGVENVPHRIKGKSTVGQSKRRKGGMFSRALQAGEGRGFVLDLV